MSLAQESESRKERLLALRKRKAGGGEDGDAVDVISNNETFTFKQRNFDPETRTLRKHGRADEIEDTIEKQVQGVAEQIIAEDEEKRAQELDLFNIAPKRPNWDLKRELEKKVAKLERKTQEAIHTLIRQRLADDPTLNLSAGIKAQEKADRDDDDMSSDED